MYTVILFFQSVPTYHTANSFPDAMSIMNAVHCLEGGIAVLFLNEEQIGDMEEGEEYRGDVLPW